jgi:hypothetical protein
MMHSSMLMIGLDRYTHTHCMVPLTTMAADIGPFGKVATDGRGGVDLPVVYVLRREHVLAALRLAGCGEHNFEKASGDGDGEDCRDGDDDEGGGAGGEGGHDGDGVTLWIGDATVGIEAECFKGIDCVSRVRTPTHAALFSSIELRRCVPVRAPLNPIELACHCMHGQP